VHWGLWGDYDLLSWYYELNPHTLLTIYAV
jgi:hypothetical protein